MKRRLLIVLVAACLSALANDLPDTVASSSVDDGPDAPWSGEEHVIETRGEDGEQSQEFWYANGSSFVHRHGNNVETWGPQGRYEATILIDRYYGTPAEVQRQISSGLLPAKARLVMPVYDCDDTSTCTSCYPEFDDVYLNGHRVGRLTGMDEGWSNNLFEVPLEWLELPSHPGDVAENHLEVIVDIMNPEREWVLYQRWQEIRLPAPLPILLVHGWTPNANALAMLQETIQAELGIPTELAVTEMHNAPADNAKMLRTQLEALCPLYGVPQFNIMAHSKGGLDSRVLVDSAGEASAMVGRVMQIATPNAGSHLAEIVVNPENGRQKALLKFVGLFEPDSVADRPGVRSLLPANCALFNQRYQTPRCPVNVVAGSLRNRRSLGEPKEVDENGNVLPQPDWPLHLWLCARMNYEHDFNSPNPAQHGDAIVSVASAHTAVAPLAVSPLVSRDMRFQHANITDDGGLDVLGAYRELLMPADDADVVREKNFSGEGNGWHQVDGGAMTRGESMSDGEAVPLVAECLAGETTVVPMWVHTGEGDEAYLMIWGLPPEAVAFFEAPDGELYPMDDRENGAPSSSADGLTALADASRSITVEGGVRGVGRLWIGSEDVDEDYSVVASWWNDGESQLQVGYDCSGDGELECVAYAGGDLPAGTECVLRCSREGMASEEVVEVPMVLEEEGLYCATASLEEAVLYDCRVLMQCRLPDGSAAPMEKVDFRAAFVGARARLGTGRLEVDSGGTNRDDGVLALTVSLAFDNLPGGKYMLCAAVVRENDLAMPLALVGTTADTTDSGTALAFRTQCRVMATTATLSVGECLALTDCTLWRLVGEEEMPVPVPIDGMPADGVVARSSSLSSKFLPEKRFLLDTDSLQWELLRVGSKDLLMLRMAWADGAAKGLNRTIFATLNDSFGNTLAKCEVTVRNGQSDLSRYGQGRVEGVVFMVDAGVLALYAENAPFSLGNIQVEDEWNGVGWMLSLEKVAIPEMDYGLFTSEGTKAISGLEECRPLHPADTDGDGRIQDSELLEAWRRWLAGTIDDSIFLNAIELNRHDGYAYDSAAGKFVPRGGQK